MSLAPILFSDWWEHLDHPSHLQGQNFGHGLHHDDILAPHMSHEESLIPPIPRHILEQYFRGDRVGPSKPRHTLYQRPWVQLHGKGSNALSGLSTVKPDKDQFHVDLDIQQFAPEEIEVKVVGKHIVVHGSHEEKQDEHGWISRKFTRKYLIPEQCDIEHVKSTLSSDGVLTITCPKKKEYRQHPEERPIRIEHTGRPAVVKNDTKAVEDADAGKKGTPEKK